MLKNMFSLQILILSISMLTTSCNQPQVSEDSVTTNTISTPTATNEQNIEEIPKTITINKVEDNTETTTALDVKKATPAPLLPTLKTPTANTPTNAPANTEVVVEKAAVAVNTDTDKLIDNHDALNAMLQKFVAASGAVNYAGWKKSESDLDKYLADLAAAIPTSATSRNEALAYWINAYNAYTVKLILKNYPVASITDLNGGKPWDVQWITLAGKKYSLNDIENKVIRPTFKEPRIHFAVNCAAKSCPPLANKAFTASNLNSMLEQRTIAFMNSNLNTITPNKVSLSKIFDWYKEDFGNVISFVNKYATTNVNANAAISYTEYNWALNK